MFPEKQSLPVNTYDAFIQDPFHRAYQHCLALEIGEDDDVIHARCLGYLIRELPSQAALAVVNQIISCNSDYGKMRELSQQYINCLFRLFWRPRQGCTSESPESPTPTTLRRALRRAILSEDSEIPDTSPVNNITAKVSALKRDSYRCVVTGYADTATYRFLSPEERLRVFDATMPLYFLNTSYCDIFPFLRERKEGGSGRVWDILKDFGLVDLVNELNGKNVYNIRNGLTMIEGLCTDFHTFDLWFEEIPDHPNSYRIQSFLGDCHAILQRFPRSHIITLTTPDVQRLPLPDARYLRLHAALCRAAHLSGVAGYLESQDRQLSELGTLADDGSSAALLEYRLGCEVLGS